MKAEAAAKALFAGGSDDSNMPTTELTEDQLTDGKIAILDLMLACQLIPPRGEGRRLVQQGGVMVNEEKVESIDASYTAEQLKEGLKIPQGQEGLPQGASQVNIPSSPAMLCAGNFFFQSGKNMLYWSCAS